MAFSTHGKPDLDLLPARRDFMGICLNKTLISLDTARPTP
jgi:hypothetical protein